MNGCQNSRSAQSKSKRIASQQNHQIKFQIIYGQSLNRLVFYSLQVQRAVLKWAWNCWNNIDENVVVKVLQSDYICSHIRPCQHANILFNRPWLVCFVCYIFMYITARHSAWESSNENKKTTIYRIGTEVFFMSRK